MHTLKQNNFLTRILVLKGTIQIPSYLLLFHVTWIWVDNGKIKTTCSMLFQEENISHITSLLFKWCSWACAYNMCCNKGNINHNPYPDEKLTSKFKS